MLNERGFSLMEALTAATISVIAVMGLAYEVARAALGEAQSQLEALTLLPNSDPTLALGYVATPTPFIYEGVALGTESWRVEPYDDPTLPGTTNLKRVVMTVRWQQAAHPDSVALERLWQL
jgi:hypothetical protein